MAGVTSEFVEVTTADGATSRLGVFRPAYWPRALVVCLPALSVEARYYRLFAEALAERRLLAVSADFRGHGTSGVRARPGVDFGYAELVDYDIPAIVAKARSLLAHEAVSRARPLLIVGHSLGGQLAALYAGQAPDSVNGLVLIGACTPYHRAYSGAIAPWVRGGAALFSAVARRQGVFRGRRFRFGNDEAPGLIADWAETVRSGRYARRYEADLGSIRIPVLALSIAGDRYAPRRTVDHLVEKLSGARVTRRHLDGRDLPAPALDHFRWARSPSAMATLIDGWLGVQGI